ncbi:MAG: ABC transporter permease [Anaerolineaceae bacterium]|nr:ABC transporter permease [Anaerolineaceae bacterium]
MKKIFLIGIKDLRLMFRDRAALVLMLLAPFVLTLGLGFVTGRLGSSVSSGIENIPVVIVNLDQQQLGNALVTTFQSDDLKDLVSPTLESNFETAKKLVDDNQVAAAILVPAGFTESIIPSLGQAISTETVEIVLYTNPSSPTSAGVIKTILEGFLSQVETGRVSGVVSVEQLLANGLIQQDQIAQVGGQIGSQMAVEMQSGSNSSIKIQSLTGNGGSNDIDMLAILAPGMALMFLMYTVTNGGRSLLIEKNQGTLPRLIVTPTRTSQVLAGKVFGIFLTGFVQMLILIGGTSLLFHLQWGDPLALLVLTAAAVIGATGWGMLLTAIARTPGQVSSIGSAIMLIFGMLGGSFFSMDNFPRWVQSIAHISPNAWGMDGFTSLALGGSLQSVTTPVLALLSMGTSLFIIAVILINKRGLASA